MSIDNDNLSRIRTRITRAVRQRIDCDERLAAFIATEAVDALITDFRGERIYIAPSIIERDAQVLVDFNGRNHDTVCDRHDISRSTLYRIIKKRGQRAAPMQGETSHGR